MKSRACATQLITIVNDIIVQSAGVFVTVKHHQPIQSVAGKYYTKVKVSASD